MIIAVPDHTNVHLNIYQCSHCLRSFGRERYLQSHLKTCHSPTKDDARDEGRPNSDEPFDNVAQNRPVIPIESLLNGPAHDSSRHDRASSKKVQTRKNIPRSFITHEIEPVRENRPFQEPPLSSSTLSGKPLPFESDQYHVRTFRFLYELFLTRLASLETLIGCISLMHWWKAEGFKGTKLNNVHDTMGTKIRRWLS